MDHRRFDALVKYLYVLKNRREGLRIGVAGLVAGTTALIRPSATVACKSRGDRCQKNGQCCSGQCVDRKSKKNKNAKKEKKARKAKKNRQGADGICDCSGLQERCKGPGDCCVATQPCRATGCSDVPVCCRARNAPCDDDCECCDDDSFCDEESGRCDDCGELKQTQQGPCETADDCCFEGDICKSIAPECAGREGDSQCCVHVGSECGEDCDCCVPLKCVDEVCALPDGCSQSGEPCSAAGGSDECCQATDICAASASCDRSDLRAEDESQVCCHVEGTCTDDCDCCGNGRCIMERCSPCREIRETCTIALECCGFPNADCGTNGCGAGPRCCAVERAACTADCDCCAPLTCQGNGTCGAPCDVLCPPGSFEPCCPAGTTCATFGCVSDEAGVCPAGIDACAGPLGFCGGSPLQPQDCACFRDLAGDGFCSLGFSCDRECTTDADCLTAPGNPVPGSRCVRCQATCGHDRGVCASPCPVT